MNDFAQRSLREIGLQVGTDKITHHDYDIYYSRFLDPFKSVDNGAILEIGIENGKSLQMWLDYFNRAFIYGIDINISAAGDRYRIFKSDQSDLVNLENIVIKEIDKPVFLIVDDGSHLPEHQAITFDFLFNRLLVQGGVYIIEDIEVSYWSQGGLYGYETRYGYRHPQSIIEIFRELIDDVNEEFLTPSNRERQRLHVNNKLSSETRENISSISFAKNCIIITKKSERERERSKKSYRFSGYL